MEIADAFLAAARKYEDSDMAFQLRSMNLLYESVRDTGGIVVVPSGFNDTSFGAMAGINRYGQSKKMKNEEE